MFYIQHEFWTNSNQESPEDEDRYRRIKAVIMAGVNQCDMSERQSSRWCFKQKKR